MRDFQPSDLAEVNSWLRDRKHPETSLEMLPAIGFIEPGIAAGFLLVTPLHLGFLVGFSSNHGVQSVKRAEALLAIGDALMKVAVGKGMQRVILHTEHQGIRLWALEHGFARVTEELYMASEKT